MGLFSKKPPCPICGGKISWLLPTKIEGDYICDGCSGKLDVPQEVKNGLTMDGFRQYLCFWEENCMLREKFVVSNRLDFGLWDTKVIFDYENKLFCMSKHPDKTVFEGAQLKSFVIYEDRTPLFEGDAQCIRCYGSDVPDRAMAMAPQISQYVMNRQLLETVRRMDDDDDNHRVGYVPPADIPEPFRAFYVELRMDHPYWPVIQADMDGPRFSDTHPDLNSYLHDYQRDREMLENLVLALKAVAFPNAAEEFATLGAAPAAPVAPAAPAAPAAPDAVTEIKRYKELLDEGLISKEEFDAKKKQLMGI